MLLVTCSPDGIRMNFFTTVGEMVEHYDGGESLPQRWLTFAEAAGDPNYWPEGSGFLAEVSTLQLVPETVATSWKAAPR